MAYRASKKKKWIDHKWAAGVMMAVAVATRDYFASYDQPPPLDLISPLPCFNYITKKPKNTRYLAVFGRKTALSLAAGAYK